MQMAHAINPKLGGLGHADKSFKREISGVFEYYSCLGHVDQSPSMKRLIHVEFIPPHESFILLCLIGAPSTHSYPSDSFFLISYMRATYIQRLDFCLPPAQSPFHNLPISGAPSSSSAFLFIPFPLSPIPLNAPAFSLFTLPADAETPLLSPSPLLLDEDSLNAGSSKPVRAQVSSPPEMLDTNTNLEAETVVLPAAREPERACRLRDRERNDPLRWIKIITERKKRATWGLWAGYGHVKKVTNAVT